MARPQSTPRSRPAAEDDVEESVEAPVSDSPAAPPPTRLAGLIEVRAKYPPFVDQVEAVTIGAEFQPAKWHPWLQAQINAGWLIVK